MASSPTADHRPLIPDTPGVAQLLADVHLGDPCDLVAHLYGSRRPTALAVGRDLNVYARRAPDPRHVARLFAPALVGWVAHDGRPRSATSRTAGWLDVSGPSPRPVPTEHVEDAVADLADVVACEVRSAAGRASDVPGVWERAIAATDRLASSLGQAGTYTDQVVARLRAADVLHVDPDALAALVHAWALSTFGPGRVRTAHAWDAYRSDPAAPAALPQQAFVAAMSATCPRTRNRMHYVIPAG